LFSKRCDAHLSAEESPRTHSFSCTCVFFKEKAKNIELKTPPVCPPFVRAHLSTIKPSNRNRTFGRDALNVTNRSLLPTKRYRVPAPVLAHISSAAPTLALPTHHHVAYDGKSSCHPHFPIFPHLPLLLSLTSIDAKRHPQKQPLLRPVADDLWPFAWPSSVMTQPADQHTSKDGIPSSRFASSFHQTSLSSF